MFPYFIKNDIKQMVRNVWYELPNKFKNVEIDFFEIMKTHVHGIIVIVGARPAHGRGGPVCPPGNGPAHRPAPKKTTLSDIICWFKTITTNYYIQGVKKFNWKRFRGSLWQRGYYEHVIRNESVLNNIREYIQNNPKKERYDWKELDKP